LGRYGENSSWRVRWQPLVPHHVLSGNARDLERKRAEFQTYHNAARCHASTAGHTQVHEHVLSSRERPPHLALLAHPLVDDLVHGRVDVGGGETDPQVFTALCGAAAA